jgi:hypothetical protein
MAEKKTNLKMNEKRCHSPKFKPIRMMHTYMDPDKILRSKIEHKKVENKLMKRSEKIKYINRNEIIQSFKNRLYDFVWINSNSMLIRLEAINEENFDSLISTIERLEKDWEITKIIGESFLKVLF